MAFPATPHSRLNRLTDALFKDCSPLACYALAALLAIVFIAYLFPPAFLAGHGAFFESGDASQHVAGWLFYVRDAWHFPLLHTTRINSPEGTNVAFTDSIPLAALLFKAFRAWLPEHFHYIGLWHALAFFMQATGAAFLARALGIRHLLGTAAASFFALSWPALLWRIGHPSLMTQGIVLCAFAIYFLGRAQRWSAGAAAAGLAALSIAGLTVHPYFFAFCYPLFLAFLAEQALFGEGWLRQLPRLLASLAAFVAVAAVLGYFSHGATTTFGYGYYSMNLNAPFCGGKLIACAQESLRHEFGAYRFSDATGGQYEGYNYFGAGALLMMAVALALHGRALPAGMRRYPVLCVTLLLFTAYAVTNIAWFGMREVLALPLPAFLDRITGTFRASGRFFWPVAYLLLFVTLAALLRRRSVAALAIVALAVPLQWKDVQLLRERVIMKASAPPTGVAETWAPVMASVDQVNIYPAFGCGEADVNLYWFFQRLAAGYGKLLDTGYIARPNVDCGANTHAFDAAFRARQLYVMPAAYLDNPFLVPAGFRQASARGECVKWRIALVCQPGAAANHWRGLDTEAIAPLKDYAEWNAAALRTQAGRLEDGRLAAQAPGVLSYGPYIILPAGRYHYTIRYASRSAPTQQVGRWDIVLNGGATRELAAGIIPGTAGADGRIEGTFETDGAPLPLEIRTFFLGGGDLQLAGIELKKASP